MRGWKLIALSLLLGAAFEALLIGEAWEQGLTPSNWGRMVGGTLTAALIFGGVLIAVRFLLAALRGISRPGRSQSSEGPTMNWTKLGGTLEMVGFVVIVAAGLWWMNDFKDIGPRLECLFSSGGMCELARLTGHVSYNPLLVWLGNATIVLGGVIGISSSD